MDIQLERLTPTPEMPRNGRMNLGRRFWSLRNHHLHCRGATVEPSPAFLRPGCRAHTRFSRGATVDIASQLMINRRSATEEMLSHLFLKNYNRRANSERHYVTGAD